MEQQRFEDMPIRMEPTVATKVTGRVYNDDDGDNVSLDESGEPLVDLERFAAERGVPLEAFNVYSGRDYADGTPNKAMHLPGGLGKGVWVRSGVAEGLMVTGQHLAKHGITQVANDGFRTPDQQAAGFVKALGEVLQREQIAPAALSREDLYKFGKEANVYFGATGVDTTSPAHVEFAADIGSDPVFEAIAKTGNTTREKVVALYARMAASIERMRTAHRDAFPELPNTGLNMPIPFNYNRGGHVSGGSVDVLYKKDGQLVTPTRFDHVHEASAIMILEQKPFPEFREMVIGNGELSKHFTKCFSKEAEQMTQDDYELMKTSLRVFNHTFDRASATGYVDEWQHRQFGNIVTDPETGAIAYKGANADKYPGAGNVFHSVQTMPESDAVAIYTGEFAVKFMERVAGRE